jgi:phosphopantothenate---cysteine ligase (ATP)
VPKFLKTLVDDWAPKCMVVSYKLETDPDLLIAKAKLALTRYHHDLVIGNLLETRKREVVFVTPGRPEEWIRLPKPVDQEVSSDLHTTKDQGLEIESFIVPAVIRVHNEHIQNCNRK